MFSLAYAFGRRRPTKYRSSVRRPLIELLESRNLLTTYNISGSFGADYKGFPNTGLAYGSFTGTFDATLPITSGTTITNFNFKILSASGSVAATISSSIMGDVAYIDQNLGGSGRDVMDISNGTDGLQLDFDTPLTGNGSILPTDKYLHSSYGSTENSFVQIASGTITGFSEQSFKIDVTIFIPGVYAPNPFLTTTVGYREGAKGNKIPIKIRSVYAGDNHGFGPSESASSYRARQEVTVAIGQQGTGLTPGSEMELPGISHAYAKSSLDRTGHFKAGAKPIAEAQADGSQMHVSLISATQNAVTVLMTSNVNNALTPVAPGSKWDLFVTIDTSGSTPKYSITGSRSEFPAFEIDINNTEVVALPPRRVPFYGPYNALALGLGLISPETVKSKGSI